MKASIKMVELKKVIKALKPFVGEYSQYSNNAKMEFIFIEFNHETQEARFEALDGHRIAIEYVKCIVKESFTAYIKPFTPWKTEQPLAVIELNDGTATVDMGYYSLKFKQPDGEWYDTKKFISDMELIEPISKIGINPDFLIDALKGINLYGDRKPVIIEIRDRKEPVIIRETKDKRNIRYVFPVNINYFID